MHEITPWTAPKNSISKNFISKPLQFTHWAESIKEETKHLLPFIPKKKWKCRVKDKVNEGTILNIDQKNPYPFYEIKKEKNTVAKSNKWNADAALSLASNTMGIGIVVRDSEGMFMAGKAVQLMGSPEPHRAELLAAKEALLGFTRVILEGDARNVYNKIESVEDDLSYNGSIIRKILFCTHLVSCV